EEGLVGRLRLLLADPGDGAVGHRRGEVEVLLGRNPDDLVVLRQQRIVVAVLTAKEAPEVVEAQGVGPAVEGAGGPLLIVRREMPLAERRRAVAAVAQDLGNRGRASGPHRVVAGPPAVRLAGC